MKAKMSSFYLCPSVKSVVNFFLSGLSETNE